MWGVQSGAVWPPPILKTPQEVNPSKLVWDGWGVGVYRGEVRHEHRQAGGGLARADPSLTRTAPHPAAGFSVNGQLIGNKARSPGQHEGTYFGRLGIANPATDFHLEVTPQNITLNPGLGGPVFSWGDQASLRQHE